MTKSWLRRAGAAVALCSLSLVAIAAPGGYDPTFGTGGINIDFRLRLVEFDGLAAMPDGRIVVSASQEGSPAVLRYHPDATPDTTFGQNGIARIDLGEWGNAIALQPDGKIVIAARSYSDGHPRIARLNVNGTVDTAFGTGGFTAFQLPGHETDGIAGVAVQPDGRIVVAAVGVQQIPVGNYFPRSIAVARLLPNGQLDPTFDADGIILYDSNESYWTDAIAVDPNGRIVLAGHIIAPACCESFVARLNPDGSPDPTFGTASEVRGPVAGTTYSLGLVLQGTKIVLASNERRSSDPDPLVDFVLTRYNDNGQVDTSFGAGGQTRLRLASRNYVTALHAATNGKLWLMGEAVAPDGDRQIAVARFTANGVRDRSWRGTGASVLPLPQHPGYMRAGAMESSGNLLMGFYIGSGIKLARVLAGTTAQDDNDVDAVPNGVEPGEGLDTATKDNDVFTRARLFAMQQYRDFLGREGDAGGVDFHAARLQDGSTTRAQLVENFLNSPEFQAGVPQATRLHLTYLGRVPDYDALQYFAGLYRTGMPLETIVERYLAFSFEFGKRQFGKSNAEYVDFVYRDVLWRDADAAGRQYYLDRLGDGRMTRAAMMLVFSECEEFRRASSDDVFVNSLYAAMLRRAPDQGGFNYYLDRLANGYSRSAMIDDFLRSPEYRARFLP